VAFSHLFIVIIRAEIHVDALHLQTMHFSHRRKLGVVVILRDLSFASDVVIEVLLSFCYFLQ
jgi:hypothetical protein